MRSNSIQQFYCNLDNKFSALNYLEVIYQVLFQQEAMKISFSASSLEYQIQ